VRDRKAAAAYIVGKFGRLAHHPRQEAHRLHDVADAGESASAPLIEVGAIARWSLPFVLLMIGIVLGIYFALR
jgi:hypothetical protein